MLFESAKDKPSLASNLPIILDKLSLLDLEEYIDEVIENIYHDNYEQLRQNGGISDWNVHQVIAWIRKLKFLHSDVKTVCDTLITECVDGTCLMSLSEADWTQSLHLNFTHFFLIRLIIQGWKQGRSDWTYSAQHTTTPIGVLCGSVADLTDCNDEVVKMLSEVDENCGRNGAGGIYGQLVTLGYKEYQQKKTEVTPIGSANDIFVLERRKVPNGIKIKSIDYTVSDPGTPQRKEDRLFQQPNKSIEFSIPSPPTFDEAARQIVTLTFRSDPTRDLFQLGRAVNGGNDFVVPGVLHVDDEGCTTGPISRWACRIECERLPPFRSFVYACGFDPVHQRIAPSRVHIPLEDEFEEHLDGFSTFGIKILQPEVGDWLEVSVRGGVFHPREHMGDSPMVQVETDWGNQLTDGTIIDLGGVLLLFQTPTTIVSVPKVDPHSVVEHLNALKPHCPVLFNGITFTYQDTQERILQARFKAYEEGALTAHASGIHVPVADYSHLSEENRPYVFPACGHIFAYHKSIEHRPCPLCRQEGPFVPLAFTFEPALCSAMPTHVFNPCGHVASQEVCERWFRLWVHARGSSRSSELVHICPYCAVELHESPSGMAYSRLCLQTESGSMWPSGILPRTAETLRLEAGLAEQVDRWTEADSVAEKLASWAQDASVVATIRSQQILFAREFLNKTPSVHDFVPQHGRHNNDQGRKFRSFPKYIPPQSG